MGSKHGRFEMAYPSGDRYKGDFRNGMRHGRGVYESAKGDRYEGTWMDDMRHGNGVLTFTKVDAKGSKWAGSYEGEWIKDLKHGKGIFRYPNGDRYEGDWVKGKKTGRGVYLYANGDRYIGDFLEDDMHGSGILTYANGDLLVGQWEHDILHGECQFIVAQTRQVYDQVWDKGERTKSTLSDKTVEDVVSKLPPPPAPLVSALANNSPTNRASQMTTFSAPSASDVHVPAEDRRPSMPAVVGQRSGDDAMDDLMQEVKKQQEQRQLPPHDAIVSTPLQNGTSSSQSSTAVQSEPVPSKAPSQQPADSQTSTKPSLVTASAPPSSSAPFGDTDADEFSPEANNAS